MQVELQNRHITSNRANAVLTSCFKYNQLWNLWPRNVALLCIGYFKTNEFIAGVTVPLRGAQDVYDGNRTITRCTV